MVDDLESVARPNMVNVQVNIQIDAHSDDNLRHGAFIVKETICFVYRALTTWLKMPFVN